MSSGQPTAAHAEPQPSPAIFAGVLSYLIPGLGQISQGRIGKGVMFMVILLGMFFLGQAMGQWRNVYMPPPEENDLKGLPRPLASVYNRWHFAGQFWIGIAAWPAIWQFYNPPPPNQDPNDFWANFQRAPDEGQLNVILTNSDKMPDLGWVYTVVAGMLNILVIYDAVMGPAFLTATTRTDGEASRPATVAGGTPS
jgi:hypothetical protein